MTMNFKVAHNISFDSIDLLKRYHYIAFSNQTFAIHEFRIAGNFEKKLYTRIVYKDNYPLKKDIVLKINWKKINDFCR